MSLAQKEIIVNFLSFDGLVLRGKDIYKYLELFTNFYFWLGTRHTSVKRRKVVNNLPTNGLLKVKSKIFTNFLLLSPSRTLKVTRIVEIYCVCFDWASVYVVMFRPRVLVLVEEGYEKQTAESAGKTERQWEQRTTEGRQAKAGMDREEERTVKLIRFQGRRWTHCIRPGSTTGTMYDQSNWHHVLLRYTDHHSDCSRHLANHAIPVCGERW